MHETFDKELEASPYDPSTLPHQIVHYHYNIGMEFGCSFWMNMV